MNATMKCICETLHLFCIHGIRVCSCTYCKKAAAPHRTYTSSYNRTTASQIVAISKLAHIKQRSLPSNISSWSVDFASKYIKFLYSLPFPQEYLPRLEQFEKEHISATDIYKSTHYGKPTEYYTADCQDENDAPLLSETQKAAQAMEVSND